MRSVTRWLALALGAALGLTACGDPTTIVRTDTVFVQLPATTDTVGTPTDWVRLAALPESRRWHGSAVVDGTIYVIGGATNSLSTSILAYETATDSWRAAGTLLSSGAYNPGVVAIGERIYVVGGVDASVESGMTRLQVFDPRAGTVVDGPAMPSRRWTFAVAVLDGKVHVIGGDTDGDEFESWPAYDHDVFDPVTSTWSTRADFPSMSYLHGAVTIGGKIYVAASSGHILQYDPATDAWTQLDTWADNGHWVFREVVTLGGKMYFLGGHKWPEGCCNGPQPNNEVHRFDPATLTWDTMPRMLAPHGDHSAAVAGSSIYVLGGTASNGVTERLTLR